MLADVSVVGFEVVAEMVVTLSLVFVVAFEVALGLGVGGKQGTLDVPI